MNSGVPAASILLAVAYLAWFGAPDGAQRREMWKVGREGGSARSVAEFLPERLSGVSCNGQRAYRCSESRRGCSGFR
jgi:hypothetical protein